MPACIPGLSLKAVGLFWLKSHDFCMCSGPSEVSTGTVCYLPAVSSSGGPVTQESF